MDPKTIMAGTALVVSVATGTAVLITNKPTTELAVVAGGTTVDEAVTDVAKTGKEVSDRVCELQREGTVDGIKLAWF